MQIKPILVCVSLVLLLLFSVLFTLKSGAVTLSWQQLFSTFEQHNDDALWQQIVWQLRVPRVCLTFLAGAGLALSGAILQTITRNPLADPYLFGISSGAALGVVIMLAIFGISAGFWLSVGAFAGSMLAIGAIVLVALSMSSAHVSALILCGVALSFLFSALTSLLLYFSSPQAVSALVFWTLGSFSRAQSVSLWPIALVVLCGLSAVLFWQRALQALLLGDESAHTLGINVKRFRIIMLVLCALITALLVAACGGIGFVGLMIPHMVRMLNKRIGGYYFVLCALAGGIFMLWVDLLARTLLAHQELPVGIITSALGSGFFFLLLFMRHWSRWKN